MKLPRSGGVFLIDLIGFLKKAELPELAERVSTDCRA
jgi:hypothetical protein